MKSSWTEQLDAEISKEVRSNFKAAFLTRKRLASMLLDKVESSNRAARLKDSYDSPNWAFLQADQRGYERAMYEVIALIIEDDKEKDTSS